MTHWLTVAEATEYIRAKDSGLIRRAIKLGDLPASTYGKSEIRLTAEDLDNWLRSKPFEPRTVA